MHILGTGLSGLVGSRIVGLLSPDFTFDNLSLETGVDITDQKSVRGFFEASDARWVFHMAAFTDVQAAEVQRPQAEKSVAWKVNVSATRYIADCCKRLGKKLVYVDTDYVFDGSKKLYTEDDPASPLGWYAVTKTEGAKAVLALGSLGLVIRISNPYRSSPAGLSAQPGKKDFVHKMIDRLSAGQTITCPTDQTFTPTFIDDIASTLRVLIRKDASGLYHITSHPGISPYQAGIAIADVFDFDKTLVKQTTFERMFTGRAPTPQHAALANDKIQALGVRMHSFREGIEMIKKQEAGLPANA